MKKKEGSRSGWPRQPSLAQRDQLWAAIMGCLVSKSGMIRLHRKSGGWVSGRNCEWLMVGLLTYITLHRLGRGGQHASPIPP